MYKVKLIRVIRISGELPIYLSKDVELSFMPSIGMSFCHESEGWDMFTVRYVSFDLSTKKIFVEAEPIDAHANRQAEIDFETSHGWTLMK